MEPISALAIAALTAVAGGITNGATGELGKGVIESAKRWLAQLRQHSPDTVMRLEAASDPSVIDAEIIEEVKRVTAQQPDAQAAMEATVAAVAADNASFQNLTKLADKIATFNYGTVENQTNINNF